MSADSDEVFRDGIDKARRVLSDPEYVPPPLALAPPAKDTPNSPAGDRDTTGRDNYAGSDIDAMLDAVDSPTLFDVTSYGGRNCETCGKSLDDQRKDARHCSAACRAKGWRQEKRAWGQP